MNRSRTGWLAEFGDAGALLAAAGRVRDAGCTNVSAYAPHAVEGLDEALGLAPPRSGWWMVAGALAGGVGMLALQGYSAAIAYPLDVGGRPAASWPLFIPAALEVTLLGAAVAGVVNFMRGCRLPALHHPLWDVEAFARASDDRYFLLLRTPGDDERDRAPPQCLLETEPLAVHEVPP